MSANAPQQFSVKEIVQCGPIDDGVMTGIAEALDRYRGSGNNPSDIAKFNSKLEVYLPGLYIPVHLLREVARNVNEYQRENSRLLGNITVNAAFVPFGLFPWHADDISDAFAISTKASTQGLEGTIEAEDEESTTEAAYLASLVDPTFESHETLEIVRPPAGQLLHLTQGALHRSPPGLGEKLLVNVTVTPSFIR